ALNIDDNDATAEVQGSASITTTGNVIITASGDHSITTNVQAGIGDDSVPGQKALAFAIAITDADNTTVAREAGTLQASVLNVTAAATGNSSTTAKGNLDAVKSALGTAVAWSSVTDEARASVAGTANPSGAVNVTATTIATSTSDAR